MFTQNLYMNGYNNFIGNTQKPEAPKISMSKWVVRLQYIYSMKYFLKIKRNKRLIQ